MSWSKVVHSIFSETSLGIATLGTYAQSQRKAAAPSHSLLWATGISISPFFWVRRFLDGRKHGAAMATLPGEAELSILVIWVE